VEVLLKRNWFNPKGYRMRVVGKGTVHTMPDEWEELLPSTAIIVTEDAPVVPLISSKEPETFSELSKLQELKRDSAEAIAEDTHATLEAAKKAQAKRNRQVGMAKAREAKLQKEKVNV
jgi:hypothetical protein